MINYKQIFYLISALWLMATIVFATTTISDTSSSFTGNLAVDTNTLYVDSVNNRVGIGTTTPTSLLDISIPNLGSGGFVIKFDNPTTASEDAGLSTYSDSTGVSLLMATNMYFLSNGTLQKSKSIEESAGIMFQRGGRIQFYTDDETNIPERMRIDEDVYVGIGTESPEELIHLDKGTGFGGVKVDGSSGACLMLRDTDDAGWTKCNVLNGVMTCATDADGVC